MDTYQKELALKELALQQALKEVSPNAPINTSAAMLVSHENQEEKLNRLEELINSSQAILPIRNNGEPKARCIEPYDENKSERSKKDQKEIDKMKKLFGF
jgi:hypothetical protein